MLRLPWKSWTLPATSLLVAAVVAVSCPGNVSGSEDSARPTAPSGPVTTVPLEYRETIYRSFLYDLLFRDIPVEVQSSPFPKEPAPASGHVVRGVLKFGDNPRTPFLSSGSPVRKNSTSI